MKSLQRLWRDQRAFVASTELILLTVVLTIGGIVGLVTFRDQVVQEFGDLAAALQSLDQSFHVDDRMSFTDTSSLADSKDADPKGSEPAGLSVRVPSVSEGS